MTDKEKLVLNKKITKWLHPKAEFSVDIEFSGDTWVYPSGEVGMFDGFWLINFCDSMDTHIKWTIPKLRLYIDISTVRDGFLVKLFDGHSFRWDETNESIPLALSLAISYMIDNFKDGGK